MTNLATNPTARYDYDILETFEAGMVLLGFEVKSVKKGHIGLKGSYVAFKGEELFLLNAQISPYQPKNTPADYQPDRTRKLLLRKDEIKELLGKIKQKGLTLIPLRVYAKNNRIKLEFGLARGRKKIDKREAIKKRETERKMERALKQWG